MCVLCEEGNEESLLTHFVGGAFLGLMLGITLVVLIYILVFFVSWISS